MEYIINILDSFPSLNKLTQKYSIFLELNNKEYNLKKLIIQQDSISIRENIFNLLFKLFAKSNNKKTLIGINHINIESLNSDNKHSIIWLEFKKKMEENKKPINDINLLFYDCIRLKIKISAIKTVPKSDKKVKNKSKIKFGSPSSHQRKNNSKDKSNNTPFQDSANINIINSYRMINQNKNLIKSNSNSLKDSIKISSGNLDENNTKVNEIKNKVSFHENSNNILQKYNSNEIDPQKSISHEYLKDLMIDNDCILTDNNIFENYSYSTSLGDNNKNNKINSTNIKKIENNNEKNNNNNITEIKSTNNNDINSQHSSISPSNFNNMFKNILINSKESSNKIKKDNSFNKNMEVIKENESFSNNVNTIRKIKAQHKKNKSFNKIIYDNNKNSMGKKLNSCNKEKMNLKNKSNNINDNSFTKENLLQGCYTLNDFYHCKNLKNQINENMKNENNNKEISLKDIKTLNEYNNMGIKEIIIPDIIEENSQIDKNEKNDFLKDYKNEEERIKNNEFSTLKKDYDLFYSLKFIESIQNDLLNLEFNLALDKSISLFVLYNKEVNYYNKRKKELISIIHNYMNQVQQIHKKINILNKKKRKIDFIDKNKLILNESIININKDILSQKSIFENLIKNKRNKKDQLKSIISSLMKTNPSILEIINNNKNRDNKDEKEEKNININLINSSPTKSVKNQLKSPKYESKKLFKKDSKYDKINNKKLIYKKNKSVKNKFTISTNINKDLQKNNSINNLLSYENLNKNNVNKKSSDINNIHFIHKNIGNKKINNYIYYETARNKFYNYNLGKLK